jgi:hypothetical protein
VSAGQADAVFVPLRIMSGGRQLRFLNMVATFGTALDVTAAELVIEASYPGVRGHDSEPNAITARPAL